uniref:Retinoic acid receptor responder protein 2 n=1 Tax=Pelusios castaneus TaxID=367368 RepID=A0A8C8RV55_9SAUR
MKGLFTLWLGFVALAAASRSPLQQRTVELVLEDLHSKNYVQWVFKEQAVEDVTEIEDSRGLFVRLRVMLQQTWCRKLPGWSQDCVFKHNGRKRSCLACFKFDNSRPANVLARYVRCMVERQPAAKLGQHPSCQGAAGTLPPETGRPHRCCPGDHSLLPCCMAELGNPNKPPPPPTLHGWAQLLQPCTQALSRVAGTCRLQ